MAAPTKLALCIFLVFALPSSAAPYQYPLSSTSIRSAFFLGQRNDEKTAEFLSHYVRALPAPAKGPHVARIEIATPYCQVVKHAVVNLPGYTALDAEEEFQCKSGSFLVTVSIYLTPTYSPSWLERKDGSYVMHPERLELWRDFHVRLTQDKEIAPSKITGWPIHAANGHGTIAGAEMTLVFAADKIQSAPAEIDVETPDGAHVAVTFDLGKLQ